MEKKKAPRPRQFDFNDFLTVLAHLPVRMYHVIMAKEIERKFLVTGDGWRQAEPVRYRQGYLSTDPGRTVRVRIAGDRAKLTIKGKTAGCTRSEFEYSIPLEDAEELLELCEQPIIDKDRRKIDVGGFTWEVDEFHGENGGLILAEIELDAEGRRFPLPGWVGREVTDDPRYYNANLVTNPVARWSRFPE